ncbi:OLC1v1036413C2 [Oldenlandia corymbosa var. corymbosa]|nr:OLC1v1036413C2 [Oldenlandia corymbosa var. corymbosa]
MVMALSIRPNVLSPAAMVELQNLCGKIVSYLEQFYKGRLRENGDRRYLLGFARLYELKKVEPRLLVWRGSKGFFAWPRIIFCRFKLAMSSSKNTVGLFGDSKIFDIKNSDDEGSLSKNETQVGFTTFPPALSRKKGTAENLNASPWSSSYTTAVAIFHFGDDRIECPIIEEVAETMTDEEALKMLTTSLASILMRKKKLREKISNLEFEKGFLEHEKTIHEEAKKKEQLMRAAKGGELATAQAMYKELEAKLKEYGKTHIPKTELQKWMTAFWARMMPIALMDNVMVGISEAAIARGGHGMVVAALERMEFGKPGLCVAPSPKSQMGSHLEITSFEGDAPTVLPAKLGEEMRVPELDQYFIGVELVSDEDFSKKVEEDKEEEREPEVEKEPAGVKEVQRFQQKEEEWRRRLHQYDLDFQESLILESSISDEMKKLKDENARLRKREKIAVSPWFLEKFEQLALVEKQIEVRTERFIAAIDLLKKRTKKTEFYSKQVAVLQNILVDNEIPLPIFDDHDPVDEAKERTAAEEYLLRTGEKDWEIIDLKDNLSHCINQLRAVGYSGVIKPSPSQP